MERRIGRVIVSGNPFVCHGTEIIIYPLTKSIVTHRERETERGGCVKFPFVVHEGEIYAV